MGQNSGENAGNNNNAAGNSADQSDNGGNNTTLTLGDKLDKKMNGIIKALDTIKKKEGIDTAIEETQKLQEQLDAKLAKLTKEKMQKDKEVKAAKRKLRLLNTQAPNTFSICTTQKGHSRSLAFFLRGCFRFVWSCS